MKKYLLIIAALLALTSCLDNKLDEDFKEINEVKRWENIEEKYTVYAGEEVVLAPKVVFTIDSINPEMEFEWYVGTELVSTEPTYTFMSNQIATHNVTFCPIDKKSGMHFNKLIRIAVQSQYETGWMVLSSEGNKSILSIVMGKKEETEDGVEYLTYIGVRKDIYPLHNDGQALGSGPRKLVEHYVQDDYATIPGEIMVLQQEQPLELHGFSMEKEVFVADEFLVGIPANFNVVDATQSASGGYLLNADGTILYKKNYDLEAYHVGTYSDLPLFDGKKFKSITPSIYPQTPYLLALDEDNTLYGIWEKESRPTGDFYYNAEIAPFFTTENDVDMSLFQNIEGEVVASGFHHSDSYVTIIKQNGKYLMNNYQTYPSGRRGSRSVEVLESKIHEMSASMFTDFVDMAVLPYRDYMLIASGNTLYFHEYYRDNFKEGVVKTFNHKITSIAFKDFNPYRHEANAHVAIGLENGDLYIFEIDDNDMTKTTPLFEAHDLGKIVDVIFKYSSWGDVKYGYF